MIACLSLAAACGGGGTSGGAGAAETDSVSITVAGVGTTLYTETTSTLSPSGYSPYLTVSYPTPSIGTYLYSLDWGGAGWATRFEIHVWGGGPGTYNIISDNSMVYFEPAGGPPYSSLSSIPAASGTITVTEFGAPGEKVKGTFDVISLIVGSPSLTAHVTGRFSVTRN
jgi:hypothetical protein